MIPYRGRRRFARVRSKRTGSALMMFVFSMVLFIASLAFVIDLCIIAKEKGQMQNAADAAALAGAKRLPDKKEVRRVAQKFSDFNTSEAIELKKEDVEVGVWDPNTATFSVDPGGSAINNAVRVTCIRSVKRKNALALSFARLLGHESAEVTQTGIAQSRSIQCGQIIGIDRAVLDGSSQTDSFRSSDGPYHSARAGFKGHVCSNGPITLGGSTLIKGNATSGPGFSVALKSSSKVTGEIKELSKAMNFPPVDPGFAVTVNDNAKLPLTSSGSKVLDASGNFSMKGGEKITLPPGTYYFKSITMSGNSSFSISGATKIYVTGDIDMRGGTTANLSGTPSNFRLFPMGSNCLLSGGTDLQAILYAPQTFVERGGSSDFYGSIVAKSLRLYGSGGIHADESLDAIPLQINQNRSFLVK